MPGFSNSLAMNEVRSTKLVIQDLPAMKSCWDGWMVSLTCAYLRVLYLFFYNFALTNRVLILLLTWFCFTSFWYDKQILCLMGRFSNNRTFYLLFLLDISQYFTSLLVLTYELTWQKLFSWMSTKKNIVNWTYHFEKYYLNFKSVDSDAVGKIKALNISIVDKHALQKICFKPATATAGC